MEELIKKHNHFINLFLYKDHYCLITSLPTLIKKQMEITKRVKRYICHRCLADCTSPQKFFNHIRFCIGNKANKAVVEFPTEKYIKFKNYNHKTKVPFAVYYDFECMFNELGDDNIMNNEGAFTCSNSCCI